MTELTAREPVTVDVPPRACSSCGVQADEESGGGVRLRRCTSCQKQWYCSRECQKKDWKRHRTECRPLREKPSAQEAWQELEQILRSTSVAKATEGYHRASDEIASTKSTENDTVQPQDGETNSIGTGSSSSRENDRQAASSNEESKDVLTVGTKPRARTTTDVSDLTTRSATKGTSHGKDAVPDEIIPNNPRAVGIPDSVMGTALRGETAPTAPRPLIKHPIVPVFHNDWDFFLEDMVNLNCYRLDVRSQSPDQAPIMKLEDWSIRMEKEATHSEHSTIRLHHESSATDLTLLLLGRIHDVIESASVMDNRLSLRLSYESSAEPFSYLTLLTKEATSLVRCHACGLQLVADPAIPASDSESASTVASTRIQRVLALPSGWWDDMSDYLICYDGQANVDFSASSTVGQRRAVLEDDTVLVYHIADLSPNVQVLALPGLGDPSLEKATGNDEAPLDETKEETAVEAFQRGNQSWRDAIGGATVTCSRCCSRLGVAPLALEDTVRFYKHRLEGPDGQPLLSSLAFVTHEMIRYAEGKAIFSLVVRNEGSSGGKSAALVLQLVGWDRFGARSYANETTGELAWSRLAKILYEERHLPTTYKPSATNWMWNDGDWCCPPTPPPSSETGQDDTDDATNPTTMSDSLLQSYISLYLESQEWDRLKTELGTASGGCSKEMAAATYLAKNGRLPEAQEDLCYGLATIFLT
jgi:hypothetical protein